MSASSISEQNIDPPAVTAQESEEALRYYSATQWQLMCWCFMHLFIFPVIRVSNYG